MGPLLQLKQRRAVEQDPVQGDQMNDASVVAAARMRAAARSQPAVFEGYASLFGVVDAGGDIIAPGAFRRSIAERGAAGIRMLFQHDPAQPVGVWFDMREDGTGLFVRGRLSDGVARSRELAALLGDGAIDGLSIGFRTRSAARDRAMAGARVNGLKATARPAALPSAGPPGGRRLLHAASSLRAPTGIAARMRRGATLLQH
jgi:HK97 family phage prohead protease